MRRKGDHSICAWLGCWQVFEKVPYFKGNYTYFYWKLYIRRLYEPPYKCQFGGYLFLVRRFTGGGGTKIRLRNLGRGTQIRSTNLGGIRFLPASRAEKSTPPLVVNSDRPLMALPVCAIIRAILLSIKIFLPLPSFHHLCYFLSANPWVNHVPTGFVGLEKCVWHPVPPGTWCRSTLRVLCQSRVHKLLFHLVTLQSTKPFTLVFLNANNLYQ